MRVLVLVAQDRSAVMSHIRRDSVERDAVRVISADQSGEKTRQRLGWRPIHLDPESEIQSVA
jgi:hypothetical protein